jgi:cellulose synthase (UDP-forming)
VYLACDEITGPLQAADAEVSGVRYRRLLDFRARRRLGWLVVLNLAATATFIVWLALPERLPGLSPFGVPGHIAGRVAFYTIVAVEILRFLQVGVLWIFARKACDPVPLEPPTGSRVAVLTTIVPAKEPIAMVAKTLKAMKEIEHDCEIDVWILDEGDDPAVKRVADELGIKHFSRKGRPEFNQPKGAYRARSKAGNHNAWRAENEWQYDFVAQMDPDHVPLKSFLKRTLGYFIDPDIAFVVAPQVYCNRFDGFVARASAVQGYVFHGIIQRGGNGLGAPLLIGTNHIYRTAAWGQVGGYQDCVIEDHLTSLHVHSHSNPCTNLRWRGVYTPDIIARGDGPRTWTDYFNQQKRKQ